MHPVLAIRGRDEVQLLPSLAAIVAVANEYLSASEQRAHVRLEAQRITLSADFAGALVRLVEEAVANACQHAFPNSNEGIVRVATNIDSENMFVVRIADTGVGLAEHHAGHGMDMMRSLAQELGATLTFDKPASGTGTSVVLKIALARNDSDHQVFAGRRIARN